MSSTTARALRTSEVHDEATGQQVACGARTDAHDCPNTIAWHSIPTRSASAQAQRAATTPANSTTDAISPATNASWGVRSANSSRGVRSHSATDHAG